MNVRPPAVAGQFYPGEKSALIDEIEYALDSENGRIDLSLAEMNIIGGVSPHAGYIFCLPQAVHLFQILRSSGREWSKVALLNPNHTGRGVPLSIDSHQRWSTPLGQVDVDEELAQYLLLNSADTNHPMDLDALAHRREHSGEVILPLLQFFLSRFTLLPLCMGDCSLGAVSSVASLLAKYRKQSGIDPLIIASSDFTHFKSPGEGRKLDDYALDAILALDTESFLKRIGDMRLSICGYGPIGVLIEYAKLISDKPRISLLKRGHSGESSYFMGLEQDEVVDYVSLLVYEE